jgi:hypothetical protein
VTARQQPIQLPEASRAMLEAAALLDEPFAIPERKRSVIIMISCSVVAFFQLLPWRIVLAISRGRPINDKNRFLNRVGYSTLVRRGLPFGTMACRCFVGLSSTRRRPGARSFGALRLLFTGKMIDGLGAPSSFKHSVCHKRPVTKKGIDDRKGRVPSG